MGNFRNLLESHDHLAQDQRPKTSWSRAGTRTAPGMGFLKKLQLQKFLRMIKWVILGCFQRARTIWTKTRGQRHLGDQRPKTSWSRAGIRTAPGIGFQKKLELQKFFKYDELGNIRMLLESQDHLGQDQRPNTSRSRAGTRTATGTGF